MLTILLMLSMAGSPEPVATIFADHCVQCHHVGGMAPFSVETYDQARPWAKSIARAVATKQMPPFHADGPIGKYVDDPRLTDAEIDAVVAWTRRPGRYEAVEYEQPPEPSGYALKAVMPIRGDNKDTTRGNNIANPPREPVMVSAFRWTQTGTPIHHASIQRYEGLLTRDAIPLSEYLPGGGGVRIPGYAVRVNPGNLIAMIHVGPADERSTLVATIYLEPAPSDALELPEPIMLGLDKYEGEIAAHSEHVEMFETTTESDMLAGAFTAHMHARGKSARLSLDGVEVFAVPHYSEDWQRTYVLTEPMFVEAGTKMAAELVWKNDGAAPVEFGSESDQEMGWIRIIWTPAE